MAWEEPTTTDRGMHDKTSWFGDLNRKQNKTHSCAPSHFLHLLSTATWRQTCARLHPATDRREPLPRGRGKAEAASTLSPGRRRKKKKREGRTYLSWEEKAHLHMLSLHFCMGHTLAFLGILPWSQMDGWMEQAPLTISHLPFTIGQ